MSAQGSSCVILVILLLLLGVSSDQQLDVDTESIGHAEPVDNENAFATLLLGGNKTETNVEALSCLVFVCLGFVMSSTFINLKHHLCFLYVGFVISYVMGLLRLVFVCLGIVMSTVCLCRVYHSTLEKYKT